MVVDGANGREGMELDPAVTVAGDEPDAALAFADEPSAAPAGDAPQAEPSPADDQDA